LDTFFRICTIHVFYGFKAKKISFFEDNFFSFSNKISNKSFIVYKGQTTRGGLGSKGLCDIPYKKTQKALKIPVPQRKFVCQLLNLSINGTATVHKKIGIYTYRLWAWFLRLNIILISENCICRSLNKLFLNIQEWFVVKFFTVNISILKSIKNIF
jgi:hypothetical protein